MKKKKLNIKALIIIIALLIISIVIGLFIILSTNKNTTEINKELAGKKITDGLYLYNYNIDDDYDYQTTINNNYIYNLLDKENEFELIKTDIYTNKKEKVGDIKKVDDCYCILDTDTISCTTETNKTLYSLDLKILYSGEILITIPYKNNIVTIKGKDIYLNNKIYRTAPIEFEDYDAFYDYVFKDNLYIIFGTYHSDDVCLYNVEANKCIDYGNTLYKDYDDGLLFFDKDTIKVSNTKNDELVEYKNPTNDDTLLHSLYRNELLYTFSKDYLQIYNLKNETVKLFDYRINETIENEYLINNYLYLYNTEHIYLFNLDEIKTDEYTFDELDNTFEARLQDKINNIIDTYTVDIKIRDEANIKFDIWNQNIIGATDYDSINDSLDETDEVLKRFGKEVFEYFKHDDFTGLRIYITDRIESEDSLNGEELKYYDKYAVIVNTSDYKRTLYHELMHALEDVVNYRGNEIFTEWNSYNPKGFKYKTKYNMFDDYYEYTPEYGSGDVYFVDNYGETNELEDRARIFENIAMNTADIIVNNPYLLKKAEYQRDELYRYYPTLKTSDIFNSIEQKSESN